ncbi:hypothetical protein Tco_0266502 [Tanacetum coccineum]
MLNPNRCVGANVALAYIHGIVRLCGRKIRYKYKNNRVMHDSSPDVNSPLPFQLYRNSRVDMASKETQNQLLERQELDPPTTITCDLGPERKQALYWMTESEKGVDAEKTEETLHLYWQHIVYVISMIFTYS